MENNYPYLKNKSILYRNPEGGGIYILPHITSPKEDYCFLFRNFIEVSRLQKDIIELCSGERRIKDLAQIIAQRYCINFETALKTIVNTLDIFLKKGIMEISSELAPHGVIVRGSEKYFIPLHLCLEITTRCNVGCIYCYREAGKGEEKNMDIDINKLFPKLDKLASLGLTTVEITGGEPFLHKDFSEILYYCLQKFEICAVLTSGELINDTFLNRFEDYIRNRRLIFSITIDGSKPEIHDKFRAIEGSWKKAVQGTEKILNKGGIVMVIMNLLPENIDDVENTATLMDNMDVPIFSPNAIVPAGRALQLEWAKRGSEKIEDFLNHYQDIAKRHKSMIKFSEEMLEILDRRKNCGAGYRYWILSPNGIIRPCVIMKENILSIGNLFEMEVEQILEKPLIKEFWLTKSPRKDICGDCQQFDRCSSCIYYGLLNAGTMDKCTWLGSTSLYNFVNWDVIGHIRACTIKQGHEH